MNFKVDLCISQNELVRTGDQWTGKRKKQHSAVHGSKRNRTIIPNNVPDTMHQDETTQVLSTAYQQVVATITNEG